ncbi:hypothetical protein HJFPF1_03520 [Paramyrothecium foliicola]|nr:hypothetical protein HJFPF1_03520 [Paramyrothecium foliicola]
MPDLASSIDVGFNLISRNLEASSSPSDETVRTYSMVFVARGNQSPVFNAQFPQMLGAASKKLSPETKTRLVGFSKPCSDRLSSCLGIARVSALAITHDAPGAGALWSLVQEHVPPIEVPWLANPGEPTYHETRIKSMETTIGVKKTKPEAQ